MSWDARTYQQTSPFVVMGDGGWLWFYGQGHASLTVQLCPAMTHCVYYRSLVYFLQKYHGRIMSIPLEIGYKRLYQRLYTQRHIKSWRPKWHLPYLTCPMHMTRWLNLA